MNSKLDSSNKGRYQALKHQLEEIVENEVKGAVLRSLCEEYEKGEKCSKYFFSLEQFRAKQKTIGRIKAADGSHKSDPKS